MADNLFANIPAAGVARQTIDFEDAGFNEDNVQIIYEAGNPFKSWKPDRAINSVAGFTAEKGYLIYPLQNMDVEEYFIPPIEAPSGGGSSLITTGLTHRWNHQNGKTGSPNVTQWTDMIAGRHIVPTTGNLVDAGTTDGLHLNNVDADLSGLTIDLGDIWTMYIRADILASAKEIIRFNAGWGFYFVTGGAGNFQTQPNGTGYGILNLPGFALTGNQETFCLTKNGQTMKIYRSSAPSASLGTVTPTPALGNVAEFAGAVKASMGNAAYIKDILLYPGVEHSLANFQQNATYLDAQP